MTAITLPDLASEAPARKWSDNVARRVDSDRVRAPLRGVPVRAIVPPENFRRAIQPWFLHGGEAIGGSNDPDWNGPSPSYAGGAGAVVGLAAAVSVDHKLLTAILCVRPFPCIPGCGRLYTGTARARQGVDAHDGDHDLQRDHDR